jgi:hypothetical protein
MRFGGSSASPVFGHVGMNLAAGALLGAGVFSKAYWRLGAEFTVSSGLLTCVGPAGHSRPYSGVLCDGDGTLDVGIRLHLNGVWHGTPGSTIPDCVQYAVALNGVQIFEQAIDLVFDTGSFKSFAPAGGYIGPIDVVAGDILSAGITVVVMPLIYAYSAGAGGVPFFEVMGSLTPPGDGPRLSMRGSGVVGGSL